MKLRVRSSGCRAKVSLPLVSPNQSQVKIQTATAEEIPEAASARVASGDQPYLASVPLLQESYLFGIADWYSLVTTLLNSHWDSISTALSKVDNRTIICHDLTVDDQLTVPNWTSWPWLQHFFQGLNAQHRQVTFQPPWQQLSLQYASYIRQKPAQYHAVVIACKHADSPLKRVRAFCNCRSFATADCLYYLLPHKRPAAKPEITNCYAVSKCLSNRSDWTICFTLGFSRAVSKLVRHAWK